MIQKASRHQLKRLIIATANERSTNWRGLKIGLAVLAGLSVEWLINNVSYHKLDYTSYYVHCVLVLTTLFISYFFLMRHLGGSVRLFTLMTCNLISILYSALLSWPELYPVFAEGRETVFAPIYRLTELIILSSVIRGFVCFVFVVSAGLFSRFYAMVTGRRLHI